MRATRISLALAVTLAAAACAREPQTLYMIDPATGQPVAAQPAYMPTQYAQPTYQPQAQPQYAQPAYQPPAQPQYAQQTYRAPAPPQYAQAGNRSLYSTSPASAQMAYAQPTYQPVYQQPAPQQQPAQSGGRGLFTSSSGARNIFTEVFSSPPPMVQQAPPQYVGGPYVPVPNGAYPAASYPPR